VIRWFAQALFAALVRSILHNIFPIFAARTGPFRFGAAILPIFHAFFRISGGHHLAESGGNAHIIQ
jgi:hypothetical protein